MRSSRKVPASTPASFTSIMPDTPQPAAEFQRTAQADMKGQAERRVRERNISTGERTRLKLTQLVQPMKKAGTTNGTPSYRVNDWDSGAPSICASYAAALAGKSRFLREAGFESVALVEMARDEGKCSPPATTLRKAARSLKKKVSAGATGAGESQEGEREFIAQTGLTKKEAYRHAIEAVLKGMHHADNWNEISETVKASATGFKHRHGALANSMLNTSLGTAYYAVPDLNAKAGIGALRLTMALIQACQEYSTVGELRLHTKQTEEITPSLVLKSMPNAEEAGRLITAAFETIKFYDNVLGFKKTGHMGARETRKQMTRQVGVLKEASVQHATALETCKRPLSMSGGEPFLARGLERERATDELGKRVAALIQARYDYEAVLNTTHNLLTDERNIKGALDNCRVEFKNLRQFFARNGANLVGITQLAVVAAMASSPAAPVVVPTVTGAAVAAMAALYLRFHFSDSAELDMLARFVERFICNIKSPDLVDETIMSRKEFVTAFNQIGEFQSRKIRAEECRTCIGELEKQLRGLLPDEIARLKNEINGFETKNEEIQSQLKTTWVKQDKSWLDMSRESTTLKNIAASSESMNQPRHVDNSSKIGALQTELAQAKKELAEAEPSTRLTEEIEAWKNKIQKAMNVDLLTSKLLSPIEVRFSSGRQLLTNKLVENTDKYHLPSTTVEEKDRIEQEIVQIISDIRRLDAVTGLIVSAAKKPEEERNEALNQACDQAVPYLQRIQDTDFRLLFTGGLEEQVAVQDKVKRGMTGELKRYKYTYGGQSIINSMTQASVAGLSAGVAGEYARAHSENPATPAPNTTLQAVGANVVNASFQGNAPAGAGDREGAKQDIKAIYEQKAAHFEKSDLSIDVDVDQQSRLAVDALLKKNTPSSHALPPKMVINGSDGIRTEIDLTTSEAYYNGARRHAQERPFPGKNGQALAKTRAMGKATGFVSMQFLTSIISNPTELGASATLWKTRPDRRAIHEQKIEGDRLMASSGEALEESRQLLRNLSTSPASLKAQSHIPATTQPNTSIEGAEGAVSTMQQQGPMEPTSIRLARRFGS